MAYHKGFVGAKVIYKKHTPSPIAKNTLRVFCIPKALTYYNNSQKCVVTTGLRGKCHILKPTFELPNRLNDDDDDEIDWTDVNKT